jgi:hypothetical protein
MTSNTFSKGVAYRLKLEVGKYYYMSSLLINGLLVKITEVDVDYIEYDVIDGGDGNCFFSAIKTIRPATDEETKKFKADEELEIVKCEINWDNRGKCFINDFDYRITDYSIGVFIDDYILIGYKFKDCTDIYSFPILIADGKIRDKATHAVFQKM